MLVPEGIVIGLSVRYYKTEVWPIHNITNEAFNMLKKCTYTYTIYFILIPNLFLIGLKGKFYLHTKAKTQHASCKDSTSSIK